MDLLPKLPEGANLSEKALNDQLLTERRFSNFDKVKFYEYSSAWWQDYKNIRTTFEKRAIKIYVEDQDS